ncbi:hypothetical protein U1Q18_052630 [Sarracenia purpurea var. burkii]
MAALLEGLQSSRFLFMVIEDPPQNLTELMRRAQKYMDAEDTVGSRRSKALEGSSRPDKKGKIQDTRPIKNRQDDQRSVREVAEQDSRPFRGGYGPDQWRRLDQRPVAQIGPSVRSFSSPRVQGELPPRLHTLLNAPFS